MSHEQPQDPESASEDDSLARLTELYQRSRSASAQNEASASSGSDAEDLNNHPRLESESQAAALERLVGLLGRREGEGDDPIAAFFGGEYGAGANAGPGAGLAELAGLLSRGGLVSMSNNSGLHSLVEGITRRDDPYLILETLNELSEKLLMMNNLVAERTIPANRLTKNIIDVLTDPGLAVELELQLVACRCLQNLLDLNTDYVHPVVIHGGVEALQAKLLEISYIDLAEQALQTLEVISRVDGRAIMRRMSLGASIQYLDFFTIHAQRRALTLIANASAFLREADVDKIREVFPVLERVAVEYSDIPAAEKAWLAISKLTTAYRAKGEILESLFTLPLIQRMCAVVRATSLKATSSQVNYSVCLHLLHALSRLVAASPVIACMALQGGELGSMITGALNVTGSPLDALMSAPKDFVQAILGFVCLLVPFNSGAGNPLIGILLREQPAAVVERNTVRVTLYRLSVWSEFTAFVDDIYPLLLDLYPATVDFETRRQVLVVFIRLYEVLQPAEIRAIKAEASIVSLLSSIVIKSKGSVAHDIRGTVLLAGALYISELLLDKEPSVMEVFERDGLLQDAESLLLVVQLLTLGVQEEDEEGREEPSSEAELDALDGYDHDSESDGDLDGSAVSVSDDANGSSLTTPTRAQLLLLLHRVCTSLVHTYRAIQPQSAAKLEHVRLLEGVVLTLKNLGAIRVSPAKVWVELREALRGSNSVTISSYELISSGVIEAMAQILPLSVTHRQVVSEVFDLNTGLLLVSKLQEALTRLESFAVVSSDPNSQGPAARSSAMVKQIPLQLVLDGIDESIPELMRRLSLLVQAIATFKSIELFYVTKLGAGEPCHLEFSLQGRPLSRDTTVYSAAYQATQAMSEGLLWKTQHVVMFRKLAGPAPVDEEPPVAVVALVEALGSGTTASCLVVLSVLRGLLSVPAEAYVNWKLSSKIKRQLEEPLIITSNLLPEWCVALTQTYPFLLPLETRLYFLKATSFGYSRMIHIWQEPLVDDDHTTANALGVQHKQKVRIARDQVFPSAMKVMALYGAKPTILEIEFFNEVGTGLGPTLEFYTEVSHGFTQESLGLWRSESYGRGDGFVPPGLFPAPLVGLPAEMDTKLKQFSLLGRFLAKSLLDSRTVDFRFSPAFFERIRGEQPKLLALVDPALAASLLQLTVSASAPLGGSAALDEMGLSYSVPGYSGYPLGGESDLVEASNVEAFVEGVAEATVGAGVERQIRAFVKGFSDVIPYASMHIFSAPEMVLMFGGGGDLEDWSFEGIAAAIKAAHGYTNDHPTVVGFVQLLTELTGEQRRAFVQFLTGSPILPLGGFRALRPEFTIVLKHSEDGLQPDNYLPSVMTCASYLKLPNYSSPAVMRERVLLAITEGLGAFLLS